MLGSYSGEGLGFGLAFTLKDQFSQTATRIESSLESLDARVETVANRISKHTKGMAIGGVITAAGAVLSGIFIANANHASDLEEALNKVDVVFDKYAKSVKDFVNNNSTERLGLSRQEALEAISTYGNLFTALKINEEMARDYSISLTSLAADLASFNNTSVQDAVLALRSGMTGEYESLKKYGVNVKEDLLEQKALQLGLISSLKGSLSPAIKAQAIYALIMDQTTKAQGDFTRTGDGYANMQRKLAANWLNLKTTIGRIALPMMTKLSTILTKLFSRIENFLNTPFGRFISKITFVLGIMAVIVGTVTVAYHGLRLALIYTKIAFAGIRSGAIKAGTAMWAALAPLLPILIPIAAVLALVGVAIYVVNKGMNLFNATTLEGLKSLKGFELILAKIGGVFVAIGQIWKSATSEGFSLTGEMHDKLAALGILDTVLAIGTWVVRIKELLRGVKDVFVATWEMIKKAWSFIKPILIEMKNKFVSVLESLGIPIGKLTGDMNSFRLAGKVLGGLIVGSLLGIVLSITVAFIGLAIAVISATWPIIAIIAIIAAVIWAFKNWGKITDWLKLKWQEFKQWFVGLILSAAQWGVGIVLSIKDGIRRKWDDLVNYISEKWEKIKSKFKAFFGFGDTASSELKTSSSVDYNHKYDTDTLANSKTMAARTYKQNPINNNNNVVVQPTPLNISLDGEVLYSNFKDRREMERDR